MRREEHHEHVQEAVEREEGRDSEGGLGRGKYSVKSAGDHSDRNCDRGTLASLTSIFDDEMMAKLDLGARWLSRSREFDGTFYISGGRTTCLLEPHDLAPVAERIAHPLKLDHAA